MYADQHKAHYVVAERCKYKCINIRRIVNWQRGANVRALT